MARLWRGLFTQKCVERHRWEKLSPCSIDGSSNMKNIPAEHIENLQKTPSSIKENIMFHEMLPFKYVLASQLNSCCTCTVSTDIGCRFIHLWYDFEQLVPHNKAVFNFRFTRWLLHFLREPPPPPGWTSPVLLKTCVQQDCPPLLPPNLPPG